MARCAPTGAWAMAIRAIAPTPLPVLILMVIILLPLNPLCYQINKIWAMLLISVLVI